MNLQGKRVLVFGTGKSGIGAADLLCETGAKVILLMETKKQTRMLSYINLVQEKAQKFMRENFQRKFWTALIWSY